MSTEYCVLMRTDEYWVLCTKYWVQNTDGYWVLMRSGEKEYWWVLGVNECFPAPSAPLHRYRPARTHRDAIAYFFPPENVWVAGRVSSPAAITTDRTTR